MSYYDVPEGNADRELGRKIYMDVLEDRRGFRYDQLGIEDPDIWAEIFEEMGKAARTPEGWKMVPVEPTEAMLDELGDTGYNTEQLKRRYAAMLAEAPALTPAVRGDDT